MSDEDKVENPDPEENETTVEPDEPEESSSGETSEEEAARRNRPIYLVNLYKQGPYEIEHSVPVVPGEAPHRFHVIAPYKYPLGVKARSAEGNMVMQFAAMHQQTVVPMDMSENPDIGIHGMVEWNIDDVTVTNYKEAFKKLHDELPKRIRKDIQGVLKVLKDASRVKLKLPTAEDVALFGGGRPTKRPPTR